MAAPFEVGMTPDVTVEGAYVIRFTALDAATGNLVSNVNVTSAAIIARDISFVPENVISTEPDPVFLPS